MKQTEHGEMHAKYTFLSLIYNIHEYMNQHLLSQHHKKPFKTIQLSVAKKKENKHSKTKKHS